jgi:hypothetical protein
MQKDPIQNATIGIEQKGLISGSIGIIIKFSTSLHAINRSMDSRYSSSGRVWLASILAKTNAKKGNRRCSINDELIRKLGFPSLW